MKTVNAYEWNVKTKLGQRLLTDEVLLALESSPCQVQAVKPSTLAYAHYSVGSYDWYLLGIPDLEEGIFFGLVLNSAAPEQSKFCNVSFKELAQEEFIVPIHNTSGAVIAQVPCCVERDTTFTACAIGEIVPLPKAIRKLLNV